MCQRNGFRKGGTWILQRMKKLKECFLCKIEEIKLQYIYFPNLSCNIRPSRPAKHPKNAGELQFFSVTITKLHPIVESFIIFTINNICTILTLNFFHSTLSPGLYISKFQDFQDQTVDECLTWQRVGVKSETRQQHDNKHFIIIKMFLFVYPSRARENRHVLQPRRRREKTSAGNIIARKSH